MATQPAARSSPPAPTTDNTVVEFGEAKLKFSLPCWAKHAIAVITVGGSIAGTVGIYIPHRNRDEAVGRFTDVQAREMQNHTGEDSDEQIPVTLHNGAEKIEVKHYKSDGCILVTRSTPDGVRTSQLWIPRFSAEQILPSPGKVGDVQHVQTGALPNSDRTLAALLVDRLPLAAFVAAATQSRRVQACGGRCTERHQGEPKTTYGQTKGCWVQVVRTWPDGCSQYQWYDTCHSTWDPKIYWTCCND